MIQFCFNRPARRALISLFAMLPLLLFSHIGHSSEEARWFQIEVIVFARGSGDSGEENWPRNLTLNYPFNWVELRDPEDPQPPQRGSSRWGDTRSIRDPLTDSVTLPDLQRDPYYQLPSAERQLNRHANALRRQGGHRVLFHEAWRQPFTANRETPALIIAGGDIYGSHYELEGSIRLTLSRYLHLNTNLWLTRFEPNTGQAPGSWPQLPNRPGQRVAEVPSVVNSGLASPFNTRDNNAWGLALLNDASLPEFLREPYLPTRIVTMDQQRRMRSEELHYLDHPLMGLLIRITPYDRPEAAR
ncbi:CsiV family protein [Marinimicrobium sp. ABcell2]|uniref:CsiV family protein n=1 Tax=Marinimicrobium sp. ABcell2 TaxID=3069751 RepID=UPI0027B1D9B7|nr:CsiV family protein [Marinimicrobium sp. ABcell2]MDQ2075587.1 CsiV family protein [Marinimicrobium sp. ABcell2]